MLTLESLIRKGYFAAELPPPFVTGDLASIVSMLENDINNYKKAKSKYCNYSITRVKHLRRLLGIPNPLGQIKLSKVVADNWMNISTFYQKSNLSISRPIVKENSSRALTRTHTFRQIHEEGILRSCHCKYVLTTDISRYYPTLYTHSIAWALHTKEEAKNNHKDDLLGNLLDKYIRNTQDGQTIGIPVGPDTSLVVGEIIGTAIDVELQEQLQDCTGVRYMDDFLLYFNNYTEAEKALGIFSNILKKFELEINPSKTTIQEVVEMYGNNWASELRGYDFRHANNKQKIDLLEYFTKVFELVGKIPNAYVMKYALRRIQSVQIVEENWALYEALLIRSVMIEPNVLPIVCQLFHTYKNIGYNLNKQKIGQGISEMIIYHSHLNNSFEIAWSLWILKTVDIELSDPIAKVVSNLNDPIVALIVLDIQNNGRTKNVNSDLWKRNMIAGSLYNEQWLLAYEALMKEWLPAVSGKSYITDDFFSILKTQNVSFYDGTKQLSLIDFNEKEQLDMIKYDVNQYGLPVDEEIAVDWY